MKRKKSKSYNINQKKVNIKYYACELIILMILAFFMPTLIQRYYPAFYLLTALQFRMIFSSVLFVVWLIQIGKAMEKANKKYMRGREMGTARWEDVDVFTKRIGDPAPNMNMYFSMNGRKSLNAGKTRLNNNTICVGGSGAGKTAGFIAVNLLKKGQTVYTKVKKGVFGKKKLEVCEKDMSCNIITDPKGDTARDFGVALEKMGRLVKKLDLTDMKSSLQYNPFKYIQNADEVGELVDNIIANTTDPDANSGDPFWENSEAMFDKFLFYYTWLECPQPYYKYTSYKINDLSEEVDVTVELSCMLDEMAGNPKFRGRVNSRSSFDPDVCEIWRTPVLDENGKLMTLTQTFRTVLTLLSEAEVKEQGASDLDCRVLFLQEKIKRSGKLPEKNKAIDNYNKTMRGAADTVRSIVISANARFDKFSNESLFRILDDDELDLESIATGKVKGREGITNTDLFLVIPDDKTTYNFVVGMLYTQMFQIMYRIARENNGKCPMTIGMWMDEFANIKMPTNFKQILATCRSRSIFIVIILQSLSQLKTLYPQDEWEEIVGNCDSFLYLGGNESSSHKYVSEMLGKMTIDKQSHTQTFGKQGSSSAQDDVLGRELLTDAEVGMLPNNEVIFKVRGFYSVRDKKCYWFDMPEFDYIKKFDKWNTNVQVKQVGDRLITIKKEDIIKDKTFLTGSEAKEAVKLQEKNGGKIYGLTVQDFLFAGENIEKVEAEWKQKEAKQIEKVFGKMDVKMEVEQVEKQRKNIEMRLKEAKRNEDHVKIMNILLAQSFSDEQMEVIAEAMKEDYSAEEIEKFAHSEMGVTQMKIIKSALKENAAKEGRNYE